MTTLTYSPPPSVAGFLTSDKFIDLIVGPVGSTKTTAGLMRLAYCAAQMAPGRDGIRRSRAVWVRNTREQLKDTSIPDFLKWYPDGQAGVYAKSDYKFILKFADVECEVLFRGLDDSNDVRRLLSMQLSFGVLDEFREINPDIFNALQGRLGRYPDGILVPHRSEWGVDAKGNPIQGCVDDKGRPMARLWGMTNPPDADTFWETFLTEPPENADVFFQPSGISEKADWIQHLPSGYYENLAQGKTEEWIDVYIHAKFGRSLAGRPVFSAFRKDIHVAKSPLRPMLASAEKPLIIGFDCGLNPTAVLGQIDYKGRLLVYRAKTSEGMGALRFSREILKPTLAQDFAGQHMLVVGDPAGQQRAQTDERSVFDILKAEQFLVKPARTNAISARIAAVDAYLTRMVDGEPGILIDPGCTELISTLQSKYRYKKKTNGEFEDTPEKNHPWSDLADALQYLCLHADAGHTFGQSLLPKSRKVVRSSYVYTS